LVGAAYGAVNALNPACSSEVFGLGSFGSIYGTVTLFLAAGSLCFPDVIAGGLADRFTNTSAGARSCLPDEGNLEGE
jgi:hypothetical protein